MLKNPVINWISVYDALPHENERVLVVCENEQNYMQRHVSVSTYFGKVGLLGRRWSGWKNVTHWAPLPELPKGEEKC